MNIAGDAKSDEAQQNVAEADTKIVEERHEESPSEHSKSKSGPPSFNEDAVAGAKVDLPTAPQMMNSVQRPILPPPSRHPKEAIASSSTAQRPNI